MAVAAEEQVAPGAVRPVPQSVRVKEEEEAAVEEDPVPAFRGFRA